MTDTPGDLLRRSLGRLKPKRVLVAFSGGLDSTALLICASQVIDLLPLSAVHVNHGVDPHSSDWATHCAATAAALGVSCCVLDVPAGSFSSSPGEGTLRDARYQLLAAQLNSGDLLLTAHHTEDVAESVLLAALRGGSSHELAGIPQLRPLGRGQLFRPWLGVPKSRLAELVRRQGLSWIEDPSNARSDVSRSFLRTQVLPILSQRWPDAITTLANTGARQSETAQTLDELLDPLLPAAAEQNLLAAAVLDGLSPNTQTFLVQRWLIVRQLALPPARRLRELLRQRGAAAADRQPMLQLHGYSLRCYRRDLYLVADLSNPVPALELSWRPAGQPLLQLPDGSVLKFDGHHPKGQWLVRTAEPGSRVKIAGENHHRPLAAVFQNMAIPPWLRARIPLIFVDQELVQVGNVRCRTRFTDWPSQIRWIDPTDQI